MEKDNQPNASENDGCADLLARSRKSYDLRERKIAWAVLVGSFVALVSVAINLGAVEITKLKYGELELALKNLFFLRLFLTLASFGAILCFTYLNALQYQHLLLLKYLAEERKYCEALIYQEFSIWRAGTVENKALNVISVGLGILFFALLFILPLTTFIISLYRS